MAKDIKKVTVIGAGIMGAGIAAQLANAGVEVNLLDIVPKGAEDRNIVAKSAVERMKKANPADPLNAGFMDTANAKRITVGNSEDDLESAVKESDWVVEVIIEDLDIKRDLFKKIDQFKKPDAIVSSNTSTIPLKDLIDGRSKNFAENFVVTHFFNPPRFMRLLELISSPQTKPDVTKIIGDFCDKRLGKNVIECKDTPGFIANRIGGYYLFRAISEAVARGMTVEDADAILGKPMGMPKDGVFGTLDIVGIGIVPHIMESLSRTLAKDDPINALDQTDAMAMMEGLLKEGRTGRKAKDGKGGFYLMQKNEDGSKTLTGLNLKTGEMVPVTKKKTEAVRAGKKSPRAIFQTKGEQADFAWTVMRDTLLYAASLVPEIADDVYDIDAALRDGYNWSKGPFELLDQIGVDYFVKRAKKDGVDIPHFLEMTHGHPFYFEKNGDLRCLHYDRDNGHINYKTVPQKDGELSLADIKRKSKPVIKHTSASTWDIGDGVLCVEFHSKQNSLDPSVLYVLNETIKTVNDSDGKYKAVVIHNEADNFSVGANLGILDYKLKKAQQPFSMFNDAATVPTLRKMFIPKGAAKKFHDKVVDTCKTLDRKYYATIGKGKEQEAFEDIEDLIYQGQAVYKALREAPFPVVGAPNGMALGGGCEILLHCDAVQASSETYTGLVEVGVGVIPGWGGCTRVLERVQNAQKAGFVKGGPFPALRQSFMALMMPQFSVSASGQDAKKKLWFGRDDGITMNKYRLLADAKDKALSMAPGYKPPKPAVFQLPGEPGKTSIQAALDDFYVRDNFTKTATTHHDLVVGDALVDILSGGDTYIGKTMKETDILHLERENFMSLIRTKGTQARITHMLTTNKPLREKPPKESKAIDEMRAARNIITLPKKEADGKPLTGADAKKLKKMADETTGFYKMLKKHGMA